MAYVYLVKLFGMHKIGRTDDFERRMEQLKTAALITKKAPIGAVIWKQGYIGTTRANIFRSPNNFSFRDVTQSQHS